MLGIARVRSPSFDARWRWLRCISMFDGDSELDRRDIGSREKDFDRRFERIDVLARRLMHEAGLSFQLSADCEGDAFEADH